MKIHEAPCDPLKEFPVVGSINSFRRRNGTSTAFKCDSFHMVKMTLCKFMESQWDTGLPNELKDFVLLLRQVEIILRCPNTSKSVCIEAKISNNVAKK